MVVSGGNVSKSILDIKFQGGMFHGSILDGNFIAF